GRAGTSRRGGRRLVDPDQVPRRVAHGEVARAPELLGWLLHDLGPCGAHLLEGGIEVVGAEVAAVQVVRDDDRNAGLGGGSYGDPAEALVGDVVAHFEPERIPVERQCDIWVMDLDEAGRKSEFHARNASERAP